MRAFVVRPFREKSDIDGNPYDFERIHTELIAPALKNAGLTGGTVATTAIEAGNIREDMFDQLLTADLVICDVTLENSNVYYELGIRHAFRRRHTVLVRAKDSKDRIPFDIQTDRFFEYDHQAPARSIPGLTAVLEATKANESSVDSPVFKLIPTLNELNIGEHGIVPASFDREVQRAREKKAAGWLRLLASEVIKYRPSWWRAGLLKIGDAQWKEVNDINEARKTFEEIIKARASDIPANQALNNLYERLSRNTKLRPEERQDLLTRSNQALDRLDDKLSCQDKAENLALQARNIKTKWRIQWEHIQDEAERRRRAMTGALYESYLKYLEAFQTDLNAYYPGINALQMAKLILVLVESNPKEWENNIFFGDKRKARRAREDVEEAEEWLSVAVRQAIEFAVQRNEAWALVSKADLLFLLGADPEIVRSAYRELLDPGTFNAKSARDQLALLGSLGLHPELAREAIEVLGAPEEPDRTEQPRHILLFTGHRIDPEGRTARFPPQKEPEVRDKIQEAIDIILKKYPDHAFEGWPSAAPGGDIIFLETWVRTGLPSRVYLPMPEEQFLRESFVGIPVEWPNRFRSLIPSLQRYVLSDDAGLSQWLVSLPERPHPWERGNEWVIEEALANSDAHITLLALWDGNTTLERGGTAHMVSKARLRERIQTCRVPL